MKKGDKNPPLTKTGAPRKNKPGAGRPKAGTVLLQCRVKPETKAALGRWPGKAVDALVRRDQGRAASSATLKPQPKPVT